MTTKRNIERRLEQIDGGSEYPEPSLCELLSADNVETVDQERGLVRIDGTIMDGSGLKEALEGAKQ